MKTNVEDWLHIASQENIADCLTKGEAPNKLMSGSKQGSVGQVGAPPPLTTLPPMPPTRLPGDMACSTSIDPLFKWTAGSRCASSPPLGRVNSAAPAAYRQIALRILTGCYN